MEKIQYPGHVLCPRDVPSPVARFHARLPAPVQPTMTEMRTCNIYIYILIYSTVARRVCTRYHKKSSTRLASKRGYFTTVSAFGRLPLRLGATAPWPLLAKAFRLFYTPVLHACSICACAREHSPPSEPIPPFHSSSSRRLTSPAHGGLRARFSYAP